MTRRRSRSISSPALFGFWRFLPIATNRASRDRIATAPFHARSGMLLCSAMRRPSYWLKLRTESTLLATDQ